jgi:hypothetical protein
MTFLAHFTGPTPKKNSNKEIKNFTQCRWCPGRCSVEVCQPSGIYYPFFSFSAFCQPQGIWKQQWLFH